MSTREQITAIYAALLPLCGVATLIHPSWEGVAVTVALGMILGLLLAIERARETEFQTFKTRVDHRMQALESRLNDVTLRMS